MAYYRKWRPNASQRRAFAKRMQDPAENAAYEAHRQERKEKFYNSLETTVTGAMYVPTKEQHDFAVFDRRGVETPEQEDACNQVAYGFSCNEKIDHYYIHIVNELRRKAASIY